MWSTRFDRGLNLSLDLENLVFNMVLSSSLDFSSLRIHLLAFDN